MPNLYECWLSWAKLSTACLFSTFVSYSSFKELIDSQMIDELDEDLIGVQLQMIDEMYLIFCKIKDLPNIVISCWIALGLGSE